MQSECGAGCSLWAQDVDADSKVGIRSWSARPETNNHNSIYRILYLEKMIIQRSYLIRKTNIFI